MQKLGVLRQGARRSPHARILLLRRGGHSGSATRFRGRPRPQGAGRSPTPRPRGLRVEMTLETGMPARILAGAMCVQRFDDSLNSAIHITYRISLRSSSMPEPRDPLLKVLIYLCISTQKIQIRIQEFEVLRRAPGSGARDGARGDPAEATIGMFTGVWEL